MKDYLTNDRLKNKFRNNFDMANYAIKIAKESIRDHNPKSMEEVIDELARLPNLEDNE